MYNPGLDSKRLFEDSTHPGDAIGDIRYPEYLISLLSDRHQEPLACEGYTSDSLSLTNTRLPQV
ncbi:hypothetical protein RLOatenuis_7730 [Rickettsiales bacterium]|uniref:hypothetical protein n=1 Tax=unclassified Endozoicomonas TaxID=2644528 RepID=UPI0019CDA830|nr:MULTISPECIES: hypothetical protein [unclassified Endozoicomonas]GFZ87530.1 hypothetical protein RLOatenuis_7730 [Rickettsiales bacterium]